MAHHEKDVTFVTQLGKRRTTKAVKMGASQNFDI
jgi:hypothetical protein